MLVRVTMFGSTLACAVLDAAALVLRLISWAEYVDALNNTAPPTAVLKC
jgi:hypothetical protein